MKSNFLRILLSCVCYVVALFLLSVVVRLAFTPVPKEAETQQKAEVLISPYNRYGEDVAWAQSVLALRYASSDLRNGTGQYTREPICQPPK